MKTIYYTATTFDGFIADSQNSLDWLFQFDPPAGSYEHFMEQIGAIAMGSTTYEWLLRHERYLESPEAKWPYSIPTWIFTSRDLPPIPGADLRFVRGDVVPVHAAMREAAGTRDIWLAGGGDLVGQFYDAGLLDRIIAHVAPVTLGGGAPLLPRRIVTPALRLVSAQPAGAFVEVVYDVVR